MTAADKLRAALQEIIDTAEDADGWSVSQFVVVMGLERIRDGHVEATSWYWHPPDQADWMVSGLLEAGMEMRATCDMDD